MKTKRKWRWVTIDRFDTNLIDIWPAATRPTRQTPHGSWHQITFVSARICAKEFTKLTGITIEADKPIKLEFTTRIIK